MKWENKCLNVWISGTTIKNNFYSCRITDTGDGVVLIIQKDALMIVRETYKTSVDEVKKLAEIFLANLRK